jgi:DNA replicative helicase MCM subunit Mcm2 (Cdc46/Mcm family)
VQAGILLTLLGGVQKGGQAAGSVPLRGDVHMLVVGDPGLGKSQLLQVPLLPLSSCMLS